MIKSAIPFLLFAGNCNEALAFYETVFDAKITEKTTYEEAEMSQNESDKKLIMNSTFEMGGQCFSASDVLKDTECVNGNSVSIWLEIDSEKSLLQIYQYFVDHNGLILSELEDTFWDAKYVKVSDPFGMIWELNFQR